MKASLLLEMIITSGVSMVARDYGGAIDSQAKLDAILKQASYVETGLTQMFSTAEVKELIAKAIEARNLSALIDIIKEVAQAWPGELLQYSKDIKKMLEDAGYTTEPLYLERDGSLIRPGHVDQHLSRGQVIYRLRATYISISNQQLSVEERLRAVDVFISLLICNPHLQREIIALCLTPGVMANHLDPELPHTRLYRLRDILIKMATDELYKFPETETKVHVPELKLVDEEPTEQYKAKPEPWLHFSGTDHLVAMTQEHGTFQEQVAVFSGLLNSKEGTPGTRLRDALAYLHRSEHQEGLTGVLVGAAGVDALIDLNDSRLRANEVRKVIEARVSGKNTQQTVYSHPNRKPQQVAPLADTNVVSLENAKIAARANKMQHVEHTPDLTEELKSLMRIFGGSAQLIPVTPGIGKANPADALRSVLSQLNFVNTANSVMTEEPITRVLATGIVLPKSDKQKAVEISGGDAQLRADIESLFASRGIPVKFTDTLDEPPVLTHNEVHAYQVQVGNALVVLNHTAANLECVLTAVAIEGSGELQPIIFKANTEEVPKIWNYIRKALNHENAYDHITGYLRQYGYVS